MASRNDNDSVMATSLYLTTVFAMTTVSSRKLPCISNPLLRKPYACITLELARQDLLARAEKLGHDLAGAMAGSTMSFIALTMGVYTITDHRIPVIKTGDPNYKGEAKQVNIPAKTATEELIEKICYTSGLVLSKPPMILFFPR
jgi:hypothetical protein